MITFTLTLISLLVFFSFGFRMAFKLIKAQKETIKQLESKRNYKPF